MIAILDKEPTTYEGQFGKFTIDKSDRVGVIIYRGGLILAALSFAIAANLIVSQGESALPLVTPLFALFSLGLGISLLTIHIYMVALHRVLQAFWAIGSISAIAIGLQANEPLVLYVYNHPLTLFGIGFTFAALTGIYFKEAFCFNRLETKVLTPVVPFLLLGHISGLLPFGMEQVLLAIWTIGFTIFAGRKMVQEIDPDIGDKSVFDYLEQQKVSS
ncbi:Uncharacterized integral membrane protein [Hyella patelloides LEGE 07179]|uniref:Uncharacterized integral membrane protein n=1 Tax=Hyella patelloides LEGE 07179 TaxID=945734 RepID=A0A563W4Y7_9CYAN|nr:DUF2301 domain-containing membrane protein [Hyella patelloides]VEP18707.1 Uncharacterized integral membrane protein [Hyella patelloides LEGE 07179]